MTSLRCISLALLLLSKFASKSISPRPWVLKVKLIISQKDKESRSKPCAAGVFQSEAECGIYCTSAAVVHEAVLWDRQDTNGRYSNLLSCRTLTDEDIRTAIKNSGGVKGSLLIPDAPFELLVRRSIQLLKVPALQCKDFVHGELMRIAGQCAPTDITRFPALQVWDLDLPLKPLDPQVDPCLASTCAFLAELLAIHCRIMLPEGKLSLSHFDCFQLHTTIQSALRGIQPQYLSSRGVVCGDHDDVVRSPTCTFCEICASR